jgi:hypothetical protein
VFDGAVFTRRVHPLQDNQQRALVLRVEQIVKRRQPLDLVFQFLLRPPRASSD